jgi:hypothetical protein
MNNLEGCREMELSCRHRATLDSILRWKWLGEAERWSDLAHREAASCFQRRAGPRGMGPNPLESDRGQSEMGGR